MEHGIIRDIEPEAKPLRHLIGKVKFSILDQYAGFTATPFSRHLPLTKTSD